MPRPFPVPLAVLDELRSAQLGVVTRAQLAALGIGPDKVRHELAARRWQKGPHGVVVLHAGPLTHEQTLWAAVLSQTGPAGLAGLSAAVSQGLSWTPPAQIEVVVDSRTRPLATPGVRIHVSRRFSAGDLHPTRSPAMLRLERSVVDAAAWSRSSRTACGLLAAAVQQRLTTADKLSDELRDAGPVRHSRLLSLCLGDIAGGAQSFAEIDFGRIAVSAGIPPPLRQQRRRDAHGRVRWLDADFSRFLAEVDGALHLREASYWDDMSRQNDLAISTDRHILRFSTLALRIDRPTVRRQLRAAWDRWG